MRTISKIICGIFVALFLFISVNLVIGAIQYGGTKNYSEYLNDKNRKDCIEQVYILKPKTWLSVFYELESMPLENNNGNIKGEKNVEIVEGDANLDLDNLSGDNVSGVVQENHNPYDPDYEDEFNSFFGVTSEETGELIPVQKIENLETAGFIVDENSKD